MKICRAKLGVAMINAGVDSSKQLAELAGVSVNTLSRVCNGGRATVRTVRQLAQALNVDPITIIEGVSA